MFHNQTAVNLEGLLITVGQQYVATRKVKGRRITVQELCGHTVIYTVGDRTREHEVAVPAWEFARMVKQQGLQPCKNP